MPPHLHPRAAAVLLLAALSLAGQSCGGSPPAIRPSPGAATPAAPPGPAGTLPGPPAGAPTDARIAAATRQAATAAAPPTAMDPRALLGGDTAVAARGRDAFGLPAANLPAAARRDFTLGKSFFNVNWVTAPASTAGRDGLGPTFNAQACASCHVKDGRASPPDVDHPLRPGLLLRLSVPQAAGDGIPGPAVAYGRQLQDRANLGIPTEGRLVIAATERPGHYADGDDYTLLAPRYTVADPAFGPFGTGTLTSPRIAPTLIGLGLLEAVDAATLLTAADPDDADGDEISGRAATLEAGSLGRFGWKATQPTVREQVALAFLEDIGITSALHGEQNCPPGQRACAEAPEGGRPELDAVKLDRVTFYCQTLAVPARRSLDDPQTTRGETRFADLGCTTCHRPELRTGSGHPIAALREQTIHPYTDLLLHDMGPDLADGRPDGAASGSEWRTPPLWGIGLQETVNGHTRLLHDGRARDMAEAILWHGGEAEAAREGFRQLDRTERAALLAFLESL
ncbi:MAG TPA: di-heme oxidoredictase family protein [Anaerolineae bacterium]|nr:di-heme oxidoredictase family protein [Anaerolineae bacterium]HRA21258.1 di-heme oxidoredictase family protein [Anaerolineae bacterium]